MERFYITVKDIHIVFDGKSKSTAQKNFFKCKDYCKEHNIPLLDKESVPTKAFCEILKIDYDLFVKTLQEKKVQMSEKIWEDLRRFW